MKSKSAVLVALAVVAGLSYMSPAHADPVPEGATWEQVWFPSGDGTMLHADVFLPENRGESERHPVILSIGPYFGTNALNGDPVTEEGPIARFADMVEGGHIFERGYAYVQVDSRGFGGSDGCYDYGGKLEQLDATSAVEWAAKQEWSNGKVGMWGKSYDAWTQVMALAHKPKGLEAAVVQSPINDRYNIAFMNGVHWDSGWYATPALYGGYDLAPPSVNDSPPDEFIYPAKGTLTNPTCYPIHPIYSGAMYDRSDPYWQEGEISAKARKANIPILWSHGFNDANTKPNNFLGTWDGYRGEHRAWFGQWDHVRGNESDLIGREGFLEEAMAFFDQHLKGLPAPTYPANVEVQDGEGKWRTESAWPPRDASYGLGRIPVKPGSYSDDGSEDGSWTFTQPAPYDVRFAGTPVLDVKVSTSLPNANLIALVYDVPTKGEATFVARGAYLIEEPGRVKFELFPQDWVLREGHRFGLLLVSSESWFNPIPTQQTVSIDSGKLLLPFLRYERTSNLTGGPAEAQDHTPHIEIDETTIEENQVNAKFPPRAR